LSSSFFAFTAPALTEIYPLSLHDALPICPRVRRAAGHPLVRGRAGGPYLLRARPDRPAVAARRVPGDGPPGRGRTGDPAHPPRRSEEHTSELQSLRHLVCRLLLEKKKKIQ